MFTINYYTSLIHYIYTHHPELFKKAQLAWNSNQVALFGHIIAPLEKNQPIFLKKKDRWQI